MDIHRTFLNARTPGIRRAWQHQGFRRRAIKALVALFPTAIVSIALVSASQATGSNVGDLQLTSFNTPIHAAITADATLLMSSLATYAAAASTPAPAPAPAPQPAQAPADPVIPPVVVPAVDTSSAAAWAASPGVVCIRDHESGDNYAEDTGNGYFGAYQDLLSTWESHGGTGLPNDAPPALQDQVNYEIWLSGGWGQWSTAGGCGL